MNRCTEWRGEHAAVSDNHVNYIDRLAKYEDSGLEPEEIAGLANFRERMDHIKAVQYRRYYSEHVFQDVVAYFDDRKINDDEVENAIRLDSYDSRVAVMPRIQAEKVFGFKWERDGETELL